MSSLPLILDALREFWLSCTGSPLSRSRQMAALRKLDAHLLKDIGLTPDEARRGVPFRTGTSTGTPREGKRPAAEIGVRGPYPNR